MANKTNRKISDTRTVPYNIEAEQAVLGSVLLDNSVDDKVFPVLNTEDFYSEQHRIIYDAMCRLNAKNKPIDQISVSDELDFSSKTEEAGGFDYITSLVDIVPSAANIENYVEILKRESLRRKVIEVGNEVTNKAYEVEEGKECLEYAQKLIYDVSQKETKSDLRQIGYAATLVSSQIDKIQIGEIDNNSCYTGYKQLDEFTHGFKPGEIVILAARPAVGKSAYALNIAGNVAKKYKKHVAFFSLEMGADTIAKRLFAYFSQVPYEKMNSRGGLQGQDSAKIVDAYTYLTDSPIYVDDDSMNTPSAILSKCRRLKKEHGLDLIIVDYLQLMNSENRKTNDSRANDVGDMSRKMKIYARDLGVPIILLSQMSRNFESRAQQGHTEPSLADLRESGSIEQDADIVMFLDNPSKWDSTLPKDEVILYVKKNRHGKTGDIKLHWQADTTTFKEIVRTDSMDNIPKIEPVVYNSETHELKPISDESSELVEISSDENPFEDEFEASVSYSDSGDLEI
ncbi:MAG: replicative DNA helicase [Clostridia bacterium]|nr:replicative DNA helicase [Clostridia bacterium]